MLVWFVSARAGPEPSRHSLTNEPTFATRSTARMMQAKAMPFLIPIVVSLLHLYARKNTPIINLLALFLNLLSLVVQFERRLITVGWSSWKQLVTDVIDDDDDAGRLIRRLNDKSDVVKDAIIPSLGRKHHPVLNRSPCRPWWWRRRPSDLSRQSSA